MHTLRERVLLLDRVVRHCVCRHRASRLRIQEPSKSPAVETSDRAVGVKATAHLDNLLVDGVQQYSRSRTMLRA